MALSENNGHMILFIWLLYAYGENHFIQDALWMPIKFMYKFPHNIIYDSSFLFNVFILFNSKSLILFQKSLPNIHNHLCLVLQFVAAMVDACTTTAIRTFVGKAQDKHYIHSFRHLLF